MRDLYRSAAARERVRAWCSARLDAWPVPHERMLVDTSLGSTHAVLAGSGPVAVVYLPGTNFNAATSLTLLGRLAAHCRVMALDLPGQPGLSAAERPEEDARTHGTWMAELLASLPMVGIGRVVVAGHSRGAYVGLCTDPARVDGLVLVSPAGLVKVAASGPVVRTAIPWMLRPTGARSRALLQLMSGAGQVPAADQVSWLTMVARETRTSGAPGPVPGWCTDRWRSASVRVVSGETDCFFPIDTLARAARERLGVGLDVLSGVGHLSVEDAPEAVVDRVLAVVNGH